MGAKRLRIFFLLLIPAVTVGAAWWDGLGVDPRDYGNPLHDQTADALRGDLSDVTLDDLLPRCKAVVASGLEAEETRRERGEEEMLRPQSVYGGPVIRDWLLCRVAVRRMGESGDPQWIPPLERLYEQWPAAYAINRIVNHGAKMRLNLREDTVDAYRKLVPQDASLADLARETRRAFDDDFESSSRLRTVVRSRHMRDLAREGVWPPELRSLWTDPDTRIRRGMVGGKQLSDIPPEEYPLYVSLLADPDPYVQRRVRGQLTVRRHRGKQVIPALLEFLERDDIDDRARMMAEQAIRVRGYALERTAEGIVLHRDVDEVSWVHLEWLTDSDGEWRGSTHIRLHELLRTWGPERVLPVFLEALAREDVDRVVSGAIQRHMAEVGHAPATEARGCLAAVPTDGGPPILQRSCNPQGEQ